jgi:hypothetical protein
MPEKRYESVGDWVSEVFARACGDIEPPYTPAGGAQIAAVRAIEDALSALLGTIDNQVAEELLKNILIRNGYYYEDNS